MSNVAYAKDNIILQAVRSILVGDNVNTNNDVREIHYYCADRIYRQFHNVNQPFPQIVMKVEAGDVEKGLPSGKYYLELMGCVSISDGHAQTKLSNMMARAEYLLAKQSAQLNLAVVGKNLRARRVDKVSDFLDTDPIDKLHKKTIRFMVICDDEIID